MGQAKARGSYEKRKAEGVAKRLQREQAEAVERAERARQRRESRIESERLYRAEHGHAPPRAELVLAMLAAGLTAPGGKL